MPTLIALAAELHVSLIDLQTDRYCRVEDYDANGVPTAKEASALLRTRLGPAFSGDLDGDEGGLESEQVAGRFTLRTRVYLNLVDHWEAAFHIYIWDPALNRRVEATTNNKVRSSPWRLQACNVPADVTQPSGATLQECMAELSTAANRLGDLGSIRDLEAWLDRGDIRVLRSHTLTNLLLVSALFFPLRPGERAQQQFDKVSRLLDRRLTRADRKAIGRFHEGAWRLYGW